MAWEKKWDSVKAIQKGIEGTVERLYKHGCIKQETYKELLRCVKALEDAIKQEDMPFTIVFLEAICSRGARLAAYDVKEACVRSKLSHI